MKKKHIYLVSFLFCILLIIISLYFINKYYSTNPKTIFNEAIDKLKYEANNIINTNKTFELKNDFTITGTLDLDLKVNFIKTKVKQIMNI